MNLHPPLTVCWLSVFPRDGFLGSIGLCGARDLAQLVKNPPAMRETWVQSLGWEDPLEKGTATQSSILTWRIHGLYSPWGCKESDTTERLSQGSVWSFVFLDEFFPHLPPQWQRVGGAGVGQAQFILGAGEVRLK